MKETILEIRDLRKSFGGLKAVDSVSLKIERGACSAIIGPNGAGKSTLFNLISGYHSPDSGKIIFQGNDLKGMSVEAICKQGIARSFQITSIFPGLTVYEGILVSLLAREGKSYNLFSLAKRLLGKEVIAILESIGLSDQAQVRSEDLSLGDQKRLELGITLAQNPQMLLLDEPTAGMSPVERVSTMELLRTLASDRGFTILFTEHDMGLVFSISDWIGVLHMGRLVTEGTSDMVKGNEMVRRIYLGEAE